MKAFIVKREYTILNDKKSNKIEYVSSFCNSQGSESCSTDIDEAHVFCNTDKHIHGCYENAGIHTVRKEGNSYYLQTRINLIPKKNN